MQKRICIRKKRQPKNGNFFSDEQKKPHERNHSDAKLNKSKQMQHTELAERMDEQREKREQRAEKNGKMALEIIIPS